MKRKENKFKEIYQHYETRIFREIENPDLRPNRLLREICLGRRTPNDVFERGGELMELLGDS